jgi:HK97 family phage major capsid protein
MARILSPAAAAEFARLNQEIDVILAKPAMTRADGKKVDALLGKLSAIKASGITDGDYTRLQAEEVVGRISGERSRAREAHETAFRSFMAGRPDATVAEEARAANDFLAGGATPVFSNGPAGGALVPASFSKNVAAGLAAVDPLCDPDVCTVIQEDDFKLPNLQLPGWDLSTIAATKVGETAQHALDVVPGMTQKMLNRFTYRLSLGASLEWADDQRAFDSALAAAGRAFGIGFARSIGKDMVSCTSGPTGILNGLTSAMTTANAGKIVLPDIQSVYFGVNKIYRASEKCGWLMNDAAYQLVRNATDNSGRPLLNVVKDEELLMGKPIYTAPSLPATGTGSFCVFGDLSSMNVHLSTMFIRRRLQAAGYVENGLYLLTGLMMADGVLHDPTSGSMPPVIAATLHS